MQKKTPSYTKLTFVQVANVNVRRANTIYVSRNNECAAACKHNKRRLATLENQKPSEQDYYLLDINAYYELCDANIIPIV